MCDLATSHTVIATGGSAVYSQKAMQHLRRFGNTVFIDVPLDELQQRIEDMDSRGLVIDPDEDFEHLFTSRRPLYQAYADITINGTGMSAEALAAAIEINACG